MGGALCYLPMRVLAAVRDCHSVRLYGPPLSAYGGRLAIRGTELGYGAIALRTSSAMSGTKLAYGAIGLRTCYAMSDSERYATKLLSLPPPRLPGLEYVCVNLISPCAPGPVLTSVDFSSSISLCACYTGTDIGYRAMRSLHCSVEISYCAMHLVPAVQY
eukprot:967872-Rhodomonas_salina.1